MFEEGRALIAGVFCYRRKGVELFFNLVSENCVAGLPFYM